MVAAVFSSLAERSNASPILRKITLFFDSANPRFFMPKQSKPKNLYAESTSTVLSGANTRQPGNYSQNLLAGHLPSDEIAIAEATGRFLLARVKG
jgi:hypothetical protein